LIGWKPHASHAQCIFAYILSLSWTQEFRILL
jgi:hypothetical protein